MEKALSSLTRLDQQRQWQTEELQQAQTAFEIAQSRYEAGAEDLLTVLETQRTLYAAQDLNVQLRLSRLQASIALYKALGVDGRPIADKQNRYFLHKLFLSLTFSTPGPW